jgi:crossover junction endodeoxyribonuclease RusA
MAQTALLKPIEPPRPDLHIAGTRKMAFEVVGHPEPQGSWKAFISKTTGRAMAKPTNERALNVWRDQVRFTAQAQRPVGWKCLDGPAFVSLVFIRARNSGDYLADGRNLRKGAPLYPDTAPDIDKLVRGCLDALTGVCFVNDSRVVSCVAVKRCAEPGEAERVMIEVVAL